MRRNYIDIHTHRHRQVQNVLSLYNLYPDDKTNMPSGSYFSSGIHPWKAGLQDAGKALHRLEELLQEPGMLAIGEAGLDKLKGPDLSMQQAVLEAQLHLARKYNKPVIVHCVKAHQEMTTYLKTWKDIRFIFHGFNQRLQLMEQLLNLGAHLSFGEALLCENSNAAKALQAMPAEQFFLETDEASCEINTLYKKAAALRNTSEAFLIEQIKNNFARVFFHPPG